MTKQKLIDKLRIVLSKTQLPKEIRLSQMETITDVPKFFKSHLSIIETQKDVRILELFSIRFKKALSIVGVNLLDYV